MFRENAQHLWVHTMIHTHTILTSRNCVHSSVLDLKFHVYETKLHIFFLTDSWCVQNNLVYLPLQGNIQRQIFPNLVRQQTLSKPWPPTENTDHSIRSNSANDIASINPSYGTWSYKLEDSSKKKDFLQLRLLQASFWKYEK